MALLGADIEDFIKIARYFIPDLISFSIRVLSGEYISEFIKDSIN